MKLDLKSFCCRVKLILPLYYSCFRLYLLMVDKQKTVYLMFKLSKFQHYCSVNCFFFVVGFCTDVWINWDGKSATISTKCCRTGTATTTTTATKQHILFTARTRFDFLSPEGIRGCTQQRNRTLHQNARSGRATFGRRTKDAFRRIRSRFAQQICKFESYNSSRWSQQFRCYTRRHGQQRRMNWSKNPESQLLFFFFEQVKKLISDSLYKHWSLTFLRSTVRDWWKYFGKTFCARSKW